MKKTMWLSYYLSMAMYFDQEDPDQRPKTNPEKWKKEEIPERLPYEWEYTGSSPNSLIRDLFIFLPSESRAFAWAYNGFSTQSAFPSALYLFATLISLSLTRTHRKLPSCFSDFTVAFLHVGPLKKYILMFEPPNGESIVNLLCYAVCPYIFACVCLVNTKMVLLK